MICSTAVLTRRLALCELLHRQLQKELNGWVDGADRGEGSLQIADDIRASFELTRDFSIRSVHRAAVCAV
jgi:hypothetical protein